MMLPIIGGQLKLVSDEHGWCRISLTHSGQDQVLGALSIVDLVVRLRKVLHIDSTKPQWILSLSEEHVSFYACTKGTEVSLLVQDAKGQTICELEIGANELAQWAALLEL
jgi:hypothetical protein